MQLPASIRETLVSEMEDYLGALSDHPDSEAVAAYLVEQLEALADDAGVDDVVTELEESGGLEVPLLEALEEEMSSNDEFEYTGEECVSLLERLGEIDWEEDDDDDFFDDDEDDEEDDEEEVGDDEDF